MSIDSVQEVFREVFEDPDLILFPEMTANDVEKWDSFLHVALIVALEDALDIVFSTDEMASLPNVGSLVDLIREKGADVSF